MLVRTGLRLYALAVSAKDFLSGRTLFCGLLVIFIAMVAARDGFSQTVDWTRRVGTLDLDEALGVAVDATGEYVVGYVTDELPDLDKVGGQDAFIRKYDLGGSVLWTRQFGTIFNDQARGVAADGSGVYVVGVQGASLADRTDLNNYDAFVRKYDASGNLLWARTIASINTLQNDYATAVAVDAGGVYVAGYTAGTLATQEPSGDTDGFVQKYDPSGNLAWTRQFGQKTFDFVTGIATNAAGIYVIGESDAALPGQSFAGGIYDVFVKALDASGNEKWTREFGASGFDFPGGIAADSSGVYAAGATAGALSGQSSAAGYDAFVRKFDNNGTELWTRQFASTGDALAYGISISGNSLYVAGNVVGTLPGQVGAGGLNEDQFVRKYDSQGSVIWTRQFGTALRDWTTAIAVTSSGIFVSGDTPRTLLSPTTTGDLDGTITKLIEGPLVIPSISGAAGVVNAASLSLQGGVAPGSLATLFGGNLSPSTEDRVAVQMNGISAPILANTSSQINFQVPWELAGLTQATLTVTVGAATSNPVTVPITPVAPGIFSISSTGSGQGAVLISNTSAIAARAGAFPGSRPAVRPIVQGNSTTQVADGIISIYCTGLGAVSNPPATGTPSPRSPLSRTASQAAVSVGGVNAVVIYTGLAPGYVGLYQVDAILAPATPTGEAVPLRVSLGGVGSNVVTIAVQ